MGFIGNPPLQQGIGLFSQDTFTGDGSTTTFDLTNAAPDGGDNDIQVFVDNVRQQAGSSKAYTLGFDGSSEFKRITFTSAPASGQTIFVLNPGTKNANVVQSVSDNTITAAKLQSNSVTAAKLADDAVDTDAIVDLNVSTAKLAADAINATKIADDAVSGEHLDGTVITDQTELAEAAAANDVLLIYDTSTNTLKKINASNVGTQVVTLTSVSPTNALSGDGTGNHTFTLTGTNFTGATAELINSSGTIVNFDSVTVNSATQITGVIAKSSLPNSGEPYDVRVIGSNGLQATKRDQISVDASPVFTTSSGSLGSGLVGSAFNYFVNATDPDSAGNVTFELQSGSLPPGFTLTNLAENGGTAKISGTDSTTSSTTTYNFVLRAVDAASNTSSRSFSITSRVINYQTFTSSGTFAVPAGVSNITEVLVVAGGGGGVAFSCNGAHDRGSGGGGAGGLIFMPCYPVSPGGTITVTVGEGGHAPMPNGSAPRGANPGLPGPGSDSAFGSPGDPGLGQGGVLTAKGGGRGGAGLYILGTYGRGDPGGSSGGMAGGRQGGENAQAATQPTQPGNSGAYGFGNEGGPRSGSTSTSSGGGGGGGGAGAAGTASTGSTGTNGGVGKAYTIADGSTSVYYAGGGGGGGTGTSGTGGQGGGGNGNPTGTYPGAQGGQANKGGGGGGIGNSGGPAYPNPSPGGWLTSGGKGVVIVKY